MREKIARSLVALAAVVLVAAACSTAGAPTLEGRTFVSQQVEGKVLVSGTAIRLNFERESVGIHAGCNSMGGAYRIEDGRITVPEIWSTEMACDPPRMEQERWVAELLQKGATVALVDDTLTLEGLGIRIVLVDRRVAEPDLPLIGTRWVLEGIITGETVSSVPVGVTAAIQLSDGTVDVEAGCNRGSGTVQVTPATVTFSALGLTKIWCEGDRGRVEQAVVAVLTGQVDYGIEADVLTLRTETAGLVFRAAAAS